jgi:hypothetical protein
LSWAAARGWGRRAEETPDEFRRRLLGLCPDVGAEATLLTSLYVVARYGGQDCPEPDLQRARRAVERLKRHEKPATGAEPATGPSDSAGREA